MNGYTNLDSLRARAHFRLPALAEASKHIREAIRCVELELDSKEHQDEFAEYMMQLAEIDAKLAIHYHRMLCEDILLLPRSAHPLFEAEPFE